MRALSSRFETARAIRSGSPLTTVGSSERWNVRSGKRRSKRSTSGVDERVELDVVEALGRPRSAGELDDVADEAGQLVELADDVGAKRGQVGGRSRSRVLEHLDVRAEARDRGAQLVARVGDQVALRRGRSLERVERAVEAACEARELVTPGLLEPVGEVGIAGQGLGPAREPAHGPECRARDDRAERGREQDAHPGDDRELHEQVAQLVVDLGQRASDLDRALVADPDRQYAEVDALDGHVAEVAPRAALGRRTGARIDGQPARVGRVAPLDGAVRGDLLDESRGISERVARLREVGAAGNPVPATRSVPIARRPRTVLGLHHELRPARQGLVDLVAQRRPRPGVVAGRQCDGGDGDGDPGRGRDPEPEGHCSRRP